MPPSTQIHTYHCLCSTLLLATPYDLLRGALPRRAPPALDRAYILPLPLPSNNTTHLNFPRGGGGHGEGGEEGRREDGGKDEDEEGKGEGGGGGEEVLPSLLTSHLRPGRKVVVVRREDGFEKRRVWRCGRCGVGVGYEVLRDERGKDDGRERGRVIYLLEGGLVETGEMGRGKEGEG